MAEVPDSAGGRPSEWARECFGKHAQRLVVAVPRRIFLAHERARASHDAAGLKNFTKYGLVLADACLEEFADEARELGGQPSRLGGRYYTVVSDRILFPYRYAAQPLPIDRAQFRPNVSERRRRLFRAHGPPPPDGLFEVTAGTTERYRQLRETFVELGATARLVSVFFTSSAEAGVHQIFWGEARLQDDLSFDWPHRETLPPYQP